MSWSKATPREKAEKIMQRWEELKQTRSPFFDQWQQVSKYISPFSGCFSLKDHNKNRSTRLILDSEPTQDLNILTAGLMSGASSPSRAWFKLQPNNPELADNYNVLTYCEYLQKLLLKVFHASNTYATLHQMYKELALFGIAADIVYDDFDTVIRHGLLTAGQYCVETSHTGDIDTLYRNFEMTTIQAIKAFGYQNCPEEIQKAYDQARLGDYWEFVHAIEPRLDRDYKSVSNEHFEWASIYFCVSTQPKIVRESGFKYFPCVIPRWDIMGLDPYGSSPSMLALPDIKQLYQETLRKAELIDNYTKPPLQAPQNARQRPISLASGALNFTQSTAQESLIRPIIQSTGDINALSADIERIKQSIKRAFYVDLFMMVQQTAGDRRTTVEIYTLQQEQMLSLGAVVERLQNECLGKLVNLTLKKIIDSGILPPLPQELQKSDLEIEFTSVLAQSQKSVDVNSIDRFYSAVASMAQIDPNVIDRLNADGYIDEYRDRTGVPPTILRSKEEADKIRQQRQQQQQAMQEQAMQAQSAQTSNQLAMAQKYGADASLAMQQLEKVGGGAMY